MLGKAVPLASDVNGAHVGVVGIVEHRHVLVLAARAPVPHVGAEHNRELESLAAVDGDDLHGLRVRLQPPRPLLVLAVPGGIVDAPAQPGRHGGRPEALGRPGFVQQLRNVAEIRHEPLARRARQDPLGDLVRAADRLVERGHALVAQQGGPAVQRPVQPLPLSFVRSGHLLGTPPDEARQRRQ